MYIDKYIKNKIPNFAGWPKWVLVCKKSLNKVFFKYGL
jgi:hypothetical protein